MQIGSTKRVTAITAAPLFGVEEFPLSGMTKSRYGYCEIDWHRKAKAGPRTRFAVSQPSIHPSTCASPRNGSDRNELPVLRHLGVWQQMFNLPKMGKRFSTWNVDVSSARNAVVVSSIIPCHFIYYLIDWSDDEEDQWDSIRYLLNWIRSSVGSVHQSHFHCWLTMWN